MEDNEKTDFTMDIAMANVIGFFMIVPILVILGLPFILIWNIKIIAQSLDSLNIFIVFTVIVIGAFVHEMLHGVTLALLVKNGLRSIKFGVNWKMITPYCHCTEPLKVKHYSIGVAMPLIIMGLIPAIIAIIIGNGFLLLFGILFTWAAGGDIITLIMLSSLKANDLVSDHPHKMGFYKKSA